MDNSDATLSLNSAGVYTLNVAIREDGLRIDRLLFVTDTNTIPTGMGPEATALTIVTNTIPATTTNHIIHYEYDDLYRLTGADYSGSISATYRYQYDTVGNMKAYTETVSTGSGQTLETDTTRVTRYFDDANRLMTATDFDLGSSSYTYDNNGNLTLIVPPGSEDRQHYAFDQRNLMINHALSTDGTNLQTQATFGYDGAGNRLQQVDYTSGTANTTTYANDIQGLAQVLIADDGTSQTVNLFGLDLIHQQNNQQSDALFMLTDGLGSVRQEVAADAVAATTTYDPYGNLLSQSGESNTAYGYTGERHDSTTGLLYLRARYYNPAQRSFMGRDPWRGNPKSPQSMNGWNYVEGNPTNYVDLTGLFPSYCNDLGEDSDKVDYVLCVVGEYAPWIQADEALLSRYKKTGSSGDKAFDEAMSHIVEYGRGCYGGPVPYRGTGYTEGSSGNANIGLTGSLGVENVYDFAKMQRQGFWYRGGISELLGLRSGAAPGGIAGISDLLVGLAASQYAGGIIGFRSWQAIDKDYSEYFLYAQLGPAAGPSWVGFGGGLSTGGIYFQGLPDSSIKGLAWYISGGAGFDPFIPPLDLVDGGIGITYYEAVGSPTDYFFKMNDGRRKAKTGLLLEEIAGGTYSPWLVSIPINTDNQTGVAILELANLALELHRTTSRTLGYGLASKYTNIYDDIHYYSYLYP